MSAVATDAAEAGEKAEGGKSRSKLLLLAGLPLVLVLAGAGAWFAGLLPGGEVKKKKGHDTQIDDHAVVYAPGAIKALDPFIANLSDEGGGRYLKATLQVEFVGAAAPADFDARSPQIRDSVLTLLTSRSFDDIRTPDGKQNLREEVIARLNQVLQRDAVRSIYFTEFIVQ
jgi:flagellar FliL protein